MPLGLLLAWRSGPTMSVTCGFDQDHVLRVGSVAWGVGGAGRLWEKATVSARIAAAPVGDRQPEAMAEPPARGDLDVLALPDARGLIGASAASQIGNWLYNAALLGYVYSQTRSAGWGGAGTICPPLPIV